MKKLIIFILTLLLTISLISCSSSKKTYEPPYDSLIADSANGGISQNAEIDYWSCDYFQKILMSNKSYTISGKNIQENILNQLLILWTHLPQTYTTMKMTVSNLV